jgi:pilus assembly protein CpaB
VVVTTQPPGSQDKISKIVLQNVPILAIGQITQQKEGKPVVVPTVTLDLTPDDSEKLVLASSQGQLQMLLRNVADTGTVEAKGATIRKVLGGVESPAPRVSRPVTVQRVVRHVQAVKPYSPPVYSVEIIKGKERSTKQFTQ